LRERRERIEVAFFLGGGRRRGGRITSQLVESFFNMILPFRERGLVGGIIWMCKKFQQVQLEERESLTRWTSPGYKGERIACLSRVASAKFFEAVGCRDGDFRVDSLQSSGLQLEADVVKLADGSMRHICITRPVVGGRLLIECPCRTREEFGYPCARATQLLIAGGWCTPGLPAGAVAEYLSLEAWRQQVAINIVVPPEPVWLTSLNKQNPQASLRALVSKVGVLELVPGRIPVPAGRPKLVKRPKKKLNSHFARLVSATEKGDRRKRRTGQGEIEIEAGVDDEVIGEDEDVQELPVDDGDSSGSDDSDEEEGSELEEGPGKAVAAAPRVATSLADLWLVDNVAVSKKHQQAKCSSCGSVGHKWPKCRARNVELMLVNIGAMPAEPLPLPPARPQQATKAVELLLARAVMELNPALPATELAPKKIPEKSVKAGKRQRVVTCAICVGETLHEVWRVFGMRCSSCGDGYVHFVCGKTPDWTCGGCRGGGGVAE
jgi:hypothetical protein